MPFYTDNMSNTLSADVLSGLWQLIAGDRSSLMNHGALMKIPAVPGSTVITVPEVDFLGIALLASQTNQEDAVTDTDVVDTQSQITLSRWSKRHDVSDLFANVDANGLANEQLFAMDAAMSLQSTIRDEHAKLVDDFSTTQGGGAGVDATFEDLLDCIGSLEIAEVNGPYLAMLHPLQWAQIRKDLALNSGGAIQHNSAPQAMIDGNKGLGYQARIAGLDVFTTTSVVETGGAKGGGVFARGAILCAISRPIADPDYPSVVLGGELLFERERAQSAASTYYVSHAFMGFIEGLDNKGVTLNSDN
jgi:hypothetical protein